MGMRPKVAFESAYADLMASDNKLVSTDVLSEVRKLSEKIFSLHGLCECVDLAQKTLMGHRQDVANAFNTIRKGRQLNANDVEHMDAERGKSLAIEIERLVSAVEDAATRLVGLECDAAVLGKDGFADRSLASRIDGARARLTDCARKISSFVNEDGFVLAQSARKVRKQLAIVERKARETMGNDYEEIFSGYGGMYLLDSDVWCGDSSSDVKKKLIVFGENLLRSVQKSVSVKLASQPPLSMLKGCCVNTTKQFPAWIAFGRWHYEVKCPSFFEGRVVTFSSPRVVPFPFLRSFWYGEPNSLAILVLRLVYALPVGYFHIEVLDPENYGECLLKHCGGLINVEGLLHVSTNSEELCDGLRRFDNHIGGMVKDLAGGSWNAYNEQHVDAPLPYRMLVVDSLAGVSPEGLLSLKKIMSAGSRSGVLVAMSARAMETCLAQSKNGDRQAGAILDLAMDSLDDVVAGEKNG